MCVCVCVCVCVRARARALSCMHVRVCMRAARVCTCMHQIGLTHEDAVGKLYSHTHTRACVYICMYIRSQQKILCFFQQLRLVWTQLRDQVSAQDELDMAKMRLRIRFPDEPVPQSNKKRNPLQQLSSNIGSTVETIHIIEKHQVCYDCFV